MGSYPTVVDWNNDGYHDLLVGDTTGYVNIFLNTNNNTDPVLDSGSQVYVGSNPINTGIRATPVVSDWNNDGKKDLLVGNWEGNISIFLNEGTDAAPVFNSSSFLQVGGSVFDILPGSGGGRASPRVYDWNHDGLDDLLVGELYGNIYYLENVGTSTAPVFDSAEKLLLFNGNPLKFDEGGSSTPRSRFFITDWNEDGLEDMIVGGANGTLELYVSVVPEPVSSTMFIIGGCIVGFRCLRKKKKKI